MILPWWKLLRELRVIKSQITFIPEIFFAKARQRRYDERLQELICVTSGHQKLTTKLAIYLIYQPKGIESSIFSTCRYLSEKGYAVLVVSNGKLKDADRARISESAWRVLERPNIGYDFGGYRDGLRMLNFWSIFPDLLLMLNDSIWYPIYPNDCLLDRMESAPTDFIGPTLFGNDDSNIKRGRQKFLGSFLLLFKKPVLESSAFKTFWANYVMTSNKEITIRRGERGISIALANGGFEPVGLLSRAHFLECLSSMDGGSLFEAILDINIIDIKVEKTRNDLISRRRTYCELQTSGKSNAITPPLFDEHQWRCDTIEFISRVTERPNFVVTAPITAIKTLGLTYLKKRIDLPLYSRALVMISNAESRGRIPQLDRGVSAEIAARLKLQEKD